MYKSGKLANTWTLVIIVFVFMMFLGALAYTGSILTDKNLSGDINLSESSLSYIADINNLTGDGSTNIDDFKPTKDELEDPILFNTNESSGNEKDFAIEFYTTKEEGSSIREKIQTIYEVPQKTLRLIKIPTGELGWFIDIIGWLLTIGMVLAMINLWKGGSS